MNSSIYLPYNRCSQSDFDDTQLPEKTWAVCCQPWKQSLSVTRKENCNKLKARNKSLQPHKCSDPITDANFLSDCCNNFESNFIPGRKEKCKIAASNPEILDKFAVKNPPNIQTEASGISYTILPERVKKVPDKSSQKEIHAEIDNTLNSARNEREKNKYIQEQNDIERAERKAKIEARNKKRDLIYSVVSTSPLTKNRAFAVKLAALFVNSYPDLTTPEEIIAKRDKILKPIWEKSFKTREKLLDEIREAIDEDKVKFFDSQNNDIQEIVNEDDDEDDDDDEETYYDAVGGKRRKTTCKRKKKKTKNLRKKTKKTKKRKLQKKIK